MRAGNGWRMTVPADHVLWRDGVRVTQSGTVATFEDDGLQHCFSLTAVAGALESLHGPTTCVGPQQSLAGARSWSWTAREDGRVRVRVRYENSNGPINTGVTAAVKQLAMQCGEGPIQRRTVALPHSVAAQDSTAAEFDVRKGTCRATLEEGFNMSALEHFAHYTGGKGGRDGVRNQADVRALLVAPIGGAAAAARVSRAEAAR